MKHKHRMIKIVKSATVFLLLITLVLSGIPITFAATDEPLVESVTVEPIELIENFDGYHTYKDFYKEEFRYFRYTYAPKFTVNLKDGTVIESEETTGMDETPLSYFEYNGETFYIHVSDDQSYENQWGLGTHKASVEIWGTEVSFDVTVVENPIESISAKPIELVEKFDGYFDWDWDYEEDDYTPEYFKYNYDPEFSINLKNGTVIDCDSRYFDYNGREFRIDTSDDQSYKNQWGVGKHTAKAKAMGFEISFDVTVVENPIKSITAKPIELIENYDGYTDSSWNAETEEYDLEYFRYSYSPEYTVIFRDGTEVDTYGDFDYNGKEYYIESSDDQSYENQWGVGTHTVKAVVCGYETTFDVTVIKTPVKQIKLDSIEIMQGTQGDFDNGYYEYKYFYPDGEVIFNDGTSQKIDNGSFSYNDTSYYVSISTDQSLNNQWGIGTHKVKATVLGYETELDVSIVESPIKSISVEPIELIEGTNMDERSYWDEDTYEYYDYDVYDYTRKIKFNVTMRDGTVIKCSNTGLYYEGNDFSLYSFDDQSYKNSWGVGSHKATAYIGGVSTQFEVKIVESPIKSINIPDVNITEETNGEYIDDESGLRFEYKFEPTVTVTMKDGTVIQSKAYRYSYGQYIEYKGEEYEIEYYDDQSEDNKWEVGTHKASVEVLGVGTTYNVNINETPYAKLEIIDVNPLKEVFEGDYRPSFKYRLTKKDGSTVEKHYSPGNRDLFVKTTGDWKVGKNNLFSVRYAGVSAEGRAEVISASGYEYIEQNGGLYITSCMLDKENIEIPQEIDGKKVIGIISLYYSYDDSEKIKTVTIPDSVVSLSTGFLGGIRSIEEINIGSGVSELNSDMFLYYNNLKKINISPDNKSYTSKDGVVYNKAVDKLVVYPANHGNDYIVPETVTNIDVLNNYPSVNIAFSDKSKSYKTVDGVTYTADMKKVFRCNPDKQGSYKMPETVTEISDKAFKDCKSLTDVKVSDKVTEISYGAFENCTSLASVSMPNSVKKISSYAFNKCESIKDVNMPANLETIDYSAFYDSGIESVAIPDSVKSIDTYAFYMSDLKNLTLGKSLKSIGTNAFSQTSIESVVIPDSVTDIENGAFSGCVNLGSVKISSGITEIKASVFANTALSSVVIPSGVKKIGTMAFNDCSKLNDLEIKGTSVDVEGSAFRGCPLKNYTPGSNIKSFAIRSFSGSEIKSLKVSKTVTEIAYNAFGDCKQLSDIEIPDTVLKINCKAFDNTKWYNIQPDGLVYLDHILLDNKGNSIDKNIEIKKGTKTIADGALFTWNSDTDCLENVTLPNGLKRIGDVAFYGRTGLKEINIPDSVEQIGDYAFAGCTSLTAINVSPNNKYYSSVNGVLFNKDKTELIFCPKQNTDFYTVPATVKTIKSYAFECSGVEKVVINNKNVKLENNAIGFGSYAIRPLASSLYSYRLNNIAIACVKGSDAEKYAQDNMFYYENVEPSVQTGDANGDGEINAKDRMMLTRYLAKWSGYKNIDMTAADLNNDGAVNAKDRMILTRHLAKWSGYETLPYIK